MRLSKYVLPTIFLLSICLPAAANLVAATNASTLGENRDKAEFPEAPWAIGFQPFISGLEEYTNDHFGLRETFVRANASLRWHLFREASSPRGFVGIDDWWFLLEQDQMAYREACGLLPLNEAEIEQTLRAIGETANSMKARNIEFRYLIIPRKEQIHFENLPAAFGEPCQLNTDRVEQVMNAAAPEVGSLLLYPKASFLEAKNSHTLYGSKRFHWYEGAYSTMLAADAALQSLGIKTARKIKFETKALPSDMGHLFVGGDGDSTGQYVIDPALRVDECNPKDCYPGLEKRHPTGGYSKHFKPAGNDHTRMLMITDSFGPHIAPMFSPYFDNVLQVSMNGLEANEAKAFQKWIIEDYRPTHAVVMFQATNVKMMPTTYSPLAD